MKKFEYTMSHSGTEKKFDDLDDALEACQREAEEYAFYRDLDPDDLIEWGDDEVTGWGVCPSDDPDGAYWPQVSAEAKYDVEFYDSEVEVIAVVTKIHNGFEFGETRYFLHSFVDCSVVKDIGCIPADDDEHPHRNFSGPLKDYDPERFEIDDNCWF